MGSHEVKESTAALPLAKEPVGRWLLRNLGRLFGYLALASFVSAVVVTLTAHRGPGIEVWPSRPWDVIPATVLLISYGGIGCLPGTALWLFLVARYSPEWRSSVRRTLAVATAPLIGAFWLWWFASYSLWVGALVFGLLLPLGAGIVVDFRRRFPSTTTPQSG